MGIGVLLMGTSLDNGPSGRMVNVGLVSPPPFCFSTSMVSCEHPRSCSVVRRFSASGRFHFSLRPRCRARQLAPVKRYVPCICGHQQWTDVRKTVARGTVIGATWFGKIGRIRRSRFGNRLNGMNRDALVPRMCSGGWVRFERLERRILTHLGGQ